MVVTRRRRTHQNTQEFAYLEQDVVFKRLVEAKEVDDAKLDSGVEDIETDSDSEVEDMDFCSFVLSSVDKDEDEASLGRSLCDVFVR
jgi:hypothetical protein